MAKVHSRLDVYVNDDLRWSNARIVDDGSRRTLKIKAPVANRRGTFETVLSATEATSVGGQERGTFVWDAVGPDGLVRITAITRHGGCIPCGR